MMISRQVRGDCEAEACVAYKPKPINTSGIDLPHDISDLTETLAANTHALWSLRRLSEGWRYGSCRDDVLKTHPNLVPYEELPESAKEYDRTTAMGALKLIMALGYEIRRR
jgi:hypothetical protein